MYCAETNDDAADRGWEYTKNYLEFFSRLDARNLSLIGDPERVRQKLTWVRDFYQPDGLLLEVAQGGMPPEAVIPLCQRFAQEVMPGFR